LTGKDDFNKGKDDVQNVAAIFGDGNGAIYFMLSATSLGALIAAGAVYLGALTA
jgi:hypothetical protein